MIKIIGAGLCGLATAYRLKQAGIPFSILEAKANSGGRIQSAGEITGHQDSGPSWVWPYAQPVVEAWFDELGLSTFDQYDDGDGLLDTDPSTSARQQFLPGQHGIARVHGGTHAIVRALLNQVADNVETDSVVTACAASDAGITISYTHAGDEKQTSADSLVIATPPRLAVALLPEDDSELAALSRTLSQTPTWMAPHAKVVMHYESPFWRERGLSGRVASQVGPLVEMHDHSGPDGLPAALFGFVGVPAEHRHDVDTLKAAVTEQLIRCFGKDAPLPIHITIKDWAFDEYVCTNADLTGPMSHPAVINELVRAGYWNNRLWFASSETSTVSPGLIEGALARADALAKQIVEAATP